MHSYDRKTDTKGTQQVSDAAILGLLAQILTAVQNIDIDADSIVIDADQINLNTDQLESLLIEIRDLLTILDRDYGAVGVETLRTAAQIGNSTGAASFNAGLTTAQTLRVVLPTDQTPIPVTFPAVAQVLTSIIFAGGGPPFVVPAGATSVMFKTSATYTGSINGLARVGSTAYAYESAAGKVLPSITCTVLSGTVDIEYLI